MKKASRIKGFSFARKIMKAAEEEKPIFIDFI